MLAKMNSRIAFKSMGGRHFLDVTPQRRVQGFDHGFFSRLKPNKTAANAVKVTHRGDGAFVVALWRTTEHPINGDSSELIAAMSFDKAKAALEAFENLTGFHICPPKPGLDVPRPKNLIATRVLKSMEARPAGTLNAMEGRRDPIDDRFVRPRSHYVAGR